MNLIITFYALAYVTLASYVPQVDDSVAHSSLEQRLNTGVLWLEAQGRLVDVSHQFEIDDVENNNVQIADNITQAFKNQKSDDRVVKRSRTTSGSVSQV